MLTNILCVYFYIIIRSNDLKKVVKLSKLFN